MRNSNTTRILLVGMLVLAANSLTSCATPAVTTMETAEAIVDSMAKGDFSAATTDFNATMKSQLPSDTLRQAWTQLTTQVGPFKSREGSRQTQEQGYDVAYVTCRFEKSAIEVKVVFDSSKQVSGLFMVPSQVR